MTALLSALLVAGAAPCARPERGVARPTAALVVIAPPGPDTSQLAAARARLATRYQLVDQASIRAVLEGFARPPSPEERTRTALARARESLRRFDLHAVAGALEEARAAATKLAPTEEGRKLIIEEALQEAELAIVERNSAAQTQAMALALSVQAQLKLDPMQFSPALIRLLERTRAALAARARVSLSVETVPPGALISVGGASRGPAPLVVDSLAAGPLAVWATRDGFVPHLERIEVKAASRLTIVLERLDEERRLRPLVDSLRQADASGREAAARALATALGVDAVALVEGDGSAPPTMYDRTPPRTATAVATSEAKREERGRLRRALPWMTTGLGLAGLAAGGVLGALALDRHDAAVREPMHATAVQEQSEAETLATGANICFVAGGVIAAAGLVWGIMEWGHEGAPKPAQRARLVLGPALVGIEGSFR